MAENSTIRDPDRCGCCYGAAKAAGRPVKFTDVHDYPICSLCESRIRNGLVRYVPGSGTEHAILESRCEQCRHALPGLYDPVLPARQEPYTICAWGILDRIVCMMVDEPDSPMAWHDPANLRNTDVTGKYVCPPDCLRFTPKDDENGHFRDPPPPDIPGQMTFGQLDVPQEKILKLEASNGK